MSGVIINAPNTPKPIASEPNTPVFQTNKNYITIIFEKVSQITIIIKKITKTKMINSQFTQFTPQSPGSLTHSVALSSPSSLPNHPVDLPASCEE